MLLTEPGCCKPMVGSSWVYSMVPEQLDVLVTHGPPLGRGDSDKRIGCPELLKRVQASRPRVHVFGQQLLVACHRLI